MGLFYALIQVVGWLEAGYFIAKHNYWATLAFIMCNLAIGMAGAMSEITKKLREDGHSSKSK